MLKNKNTEVSQGRAGAQGYMQVLLAESLGLTLWQILAMTPVSNDRRSLVVSMEQLLPMQRANIGKGWCRQN